MNFSRFLKSQRPFSKIKLIINTTDQVLLCFRFGIFLLLKSLVRSDSTLLINNVRLTWMVKDTDTWQSLANHDQFLLSARSPWSFLRWSNLMNLVETVWLYERGESKGYKCIWWDEREREYRIRLENKERWESVVVVNICGVFIS